MIGSTGETNGIAETCPGGRVIQAAAVIDIVCAQHTSGESLQYVVILVGALG